MKRSSFWAFIALSLAYALAMLNRTSFSTLAPSVAETTGVGAAGLSIASSAFFWTYLLCQIPAGLLVDAFGTRRVAVWGSVFMAIGGLVFAWAPGGIAGLALGRSIIAVGAAGVFLALIAYCSSYGASASSALGRGMMIGNLGGVIAGAPMAAVLALVDWRLFWLALSVAICAVAWMTWRVAPEDAPKTTARKALKDAIPQLKYALTQPNVYLACGALAGIGGAFNAFSGFGAHLLGQKAGMGVMGTGWMVSTMVAGFALGAGFWGKVGDSFDKRQLTVKVIPVVLVFIWAWLLVAPPAQPILLYATLAFCGFLSASYVLTHQLLSELCAGKAQGSTKASANCGIALGAASGQMAQGFMDPGISMLPCMVLAMFGAVCISTMAIRLEKAKRTQMTGAAVPS